jgi:thiamine-monophosphate kinase
VRLSDIGELKLLDGIRSRFLKKSRAVLTGIGDDAAVLKPGKGKLLVTTDFMLEDVHFDLNLITPFQLGFKLVSINVSDIYAMCGKPRFLLLGIAAPSETKKSFLDGLLEGVEAALGHYGALLVGGDVSMSPRKLAFSATVIGLSERPVKRSKAKPGDIIYVTGNLGDSACGLELLRRIGRPVELDRPLKKPLAWGVMEPLLRRHLMPEARRPGAVANRATSMIDVSDGLLIDLGRLCTESKVGARIYEDKIPVSEQARAAASYMGLDPMRLAVSGGEDYELLFTALPPRRAKAICIGEVTEKGMVIVDTLGQKRTARPEGYTHFG